jgi:hypothetical protein
MRAASRSQTRLKTQDGGGCSDPAVRAVWAIAADGEPNGICVGLIVGHWCIDDIGPIRRRTKSSTASGGGESAPAGGVPMLDHGQS